MKANNEIRMMIEKNNLKYWEVAYKIGISQSNFSVWLRLPMNKEREERTLKAINELIKQEVAR